MIDDEMRQAFIELHGQDKKGAKFQIGSLVLFHAQFADGTAEDYEGRIQAVNFTDPEMGYEYLIEGAPILAWEFQMEKRDK